MTNRMEIYFSQSLRHTVREVSDDRVSMVAAGVTYYILLASFPGLAVLVGLYGIFAEPGDLGGQMHNLAPILPPGALDILEKQLDDLANRESAALSITVVISFLIAVWSAISGVKALFEAMNIANDETEKRSFIHLNLLALGFTIGAMLVGLLLIIGIGVVPAALAFLHLDGWTDIVVRFAPWPVVVLLVFASILLLYRYGPSREPLPLRHILRGALIATFVWMLASAGFSYYLANFADYNATYGALGALIGLLVWIWLSIFIVIVGAEYNKERQHALEARAAGRHR
ncbi:YihY/virulence factor BrkB family protein [Gellertiella hungarica]|uniref:Membrane protein n=1 Tax=Gellertiella hungarica TaxID=1572859 RepID=A0A7W6J764_9HYPH|nr:YihY/virulence factor BrkB family protein [Gellertiella hungarica]MBB4066061.1 membrane protein [Gellertiella hungarica]